MQALDIKAKTSNPLELLQKIRSLVAMDLNVLDGLIHQELASSVPLTQEITQHIFKTKGKRIRPLLVILAALAFSKNDSLNVKHYELAAVIEFVHTATLLHDDVVDHSDLRRGEQTANAIWGNAASVLVGDFLYSRAFQILARHHHSLIMQVLSETTNAIAEGEVMQLMNQHDPDLSLENYFHVITLKTAKLFSAAATIGVILQNGDAGYQHAIAQYGLHLGITFQLIDDLLDYESASTITGKNSGDDLSDGKMTFPLIYALKTTTSENSIFIQEAIKKGDKTALPIILTLLDETHAREATKLKAKEHAILALNALQNIPPSAYRDAMEDLVMFAVEREF